jgi:hypothetical protein
VRDLDLSDEKNCSISREAALAREILKFSLTNQIAEDN